MLYLRLACNGASPKAISGRTSYLRVRLKFLPYPHLLATLFNGCAFGPPPPFTAASAWTWVDHPVSGLRVQTCKSPLGGFPPYSDSVSLRLRGSCRLTLPAPAARRTVLQKVRGRTHAVLPQLVDTGFQVLFHSPPGVLFTFPSQYCALSVTSGYLALRGGPRFFPQGFTCPVVLWILLRLFRFCLRGFHPLRQVFPVPFCCRPMRVVQSLPQHASHPGLGFSGFARRYSRNRVFFLFLRLLRCFSSPGSPCMAMDSPCSDRGFLCQVSPFGYLRICACLQLPAAFRSLPRPSSAPGAKASALCLFLLNPCFPWRRLRPM